MPNSALLGHSVTGIKPQILQKVCGKTTFSAYYWDGTGPLVMCCHGFPDTVNTWHRLVPALVASGYRVLVSVMPGYESSSVATSDHYFVSQLVEHLVGWIDHLDEEAAHLIGHDWGAVTAWLAVASHPHRFFSMTSIAIPPPKRLFGAVVRHPGQLLRSWYIGLFQLPWLPEQVLGLGNGAFIRWLWRRWSPGWEPPEALLQPVVETLAERPVRQAPLAYYRCLTRLLHPQHRKSRQALTLPCQVPSLVITGARDGCMDTRLFEPTLWQRDFMAGVELYRLMGAGHFCHLEKPDLVNAKILKFLEMHPKGAKRLADELARHLG